MAIRSKIMGLFLLPWLWCGAMPGPTQSLRNEKAEEPKSSPVRLDASNPAEVLSWVDFKLPPDAEATTISAIALVEVTVNEKGEVYEARVLGGYPTFPRPALDAAVQWKFKPMLVNGESAPFIAKIILRYMSRGAAMSCNNKTEAPKSTPVKLDAYSTPEVLSRIELEYPAWAQWAKLAGRVIIVVVVNEKGEVYEAKITSGHPWFAQMAIDAALQWKYKPLLVDGEAKPFTTAIIFPFHY